MMRAAKDAEMIDSDSDMDYIKDGEDEMDDDDAMFNTSYEEEEAYDMDGLLDADEMEAENEEGW